ncbi:gluconokinase [Rhizobium laguerreae]|uniref:gluconokinase n=1 Tax=Rhizobium laguerreae TaxID=1076926 RepID=UPI0021B0F138|nr:gluconokinase [Rhizobium laguerreae]
MSLNGSCVGRLGATYLDGDDLHPLANIAKMSQGIALNDDDRWPWLTPVGWALAAAEDPLIIGCSALKRAYRAHITQAAEAPVTFIHLAGTPEIVTARMNARTGHFMPPELLASQYSTLEPPGADENAISVNIDQPLDAIVDTIVTQLAGMRR